MRHLDVVGVRLEMPSNQPVMLLREQGTNRYLPIWIGTVEGTAIAFALEGVEPPRPLTHDLMKDLLVAVGRPLHAVHITHLDDGVFFATLILDGDVRVSARPSDAIALALRAGADVLASEELLDDAGVQVEDDSIARPVAPEPSSDEPDPEELARFREFLEDVEPEDFEGGGGRGETDPSTS